MSLTQKLINDGNAAVDEEAPFDLDGRKHGRQRQARAHGARQAAALEHDRFSSYDIGSDCAKGDGELVEILDVGDGQHEAAEQEIDALALNEAEWQLDVSVVETGSLLD